jgi:Protein of unknown function (DUF3341)
MKKDSMKGNKVVVGVFTYMDDALRAIEWSKDHRYDIRVYSPVPRHELEEVTDPSRSPVRFITGMGAVLGCISGFSLAILTSLDYPLRVSAKDIAAVPSFIVIGFECTILFGGIFTLLALLHFCRLPDLLRKIGFDPRFTQDKFGVVVGCQSAEAAEVEKQLSECGAEDTEVREGL